MANINKRELISIIVPCYNEEEALPFFYDEITKVMADFEEDYEVILVNDGSKDKTLDIMKDLAKKDNNAVHLSSLNERIGELTDQIKEARHKIKLCDDCFVDCDRIAENDKLPDRNPKFAKQQKSRGGWAR